MNHHTPAGWYQDPADPSVQRYWNGAQWTNETKPGQLPAGSTEPIPTGSGPAWLTSAAAAPLATPFWKRRWVQITGAAVVGVFAIGGIANAVNPPQSDQNAAGTSSSSAPSSTVATVTVTATQPAAVSATKPAATTPPAKPTTRKPAPSTATSEAPSPATSWTMPNEVGKNLQAAQDHI